MLPRLAWAWLAAWAAGACGLAAQAWTAGDSAQLVWRLAFLAGGAVSRVAAQWTAVVGGRGKRNARAGRGRCALMSTCSLRLVAQTFFAANRNASTLARWLGLLRDAMVPSRAGTKPTNKLKSERT